MMKRTIALLLILISLVSLTASAEPTRSRWARVYKHGDREQPRVAITVDDWYYPEQWLPQFMAVAEEYGVKMTLYPSGFNLKVEDRELWQSALDAGHEIGSHFFQHKKLTERSYGQITSDLNRYQKRLDEVLGYHYEFLTVRPPFGAGAGDGGGGMIGRWLHSAGFDHIITWDMDNTKDLDKALKTIKNGSIILMHANKHDLGFYKKLMEALKDRNYEYVTITELLNITSRYYYTAE